MCAGLIATGYNFLCARWDMSETSLTLWLHGNCSDTLDVHHMLGAHHA